MQVKPEAFISATIFFLVGSVDFDELSVERVADLLAVPLGNRTGGQRQHHPSRPFGPVTILVPWWHVVQYE